MYLDVALTGREHFVWFFRCAKDTNIAVIKGVMGLYNSVDGVTELGSTADAKRAGETLTPLTELSEQPRGLNSLRPPTVHDPPPSGSRQLNL
jgi:hypothetical protein